MAMFLTIEISFNVRKPTMQIHLCETKQSVMNKIHDLWIQRTRVSSSTTSSSKFPIYRENNRGQEA